MFLAICYTAALIYQPGEILNKSFFHKKQPGEKKKPSKKHTPHVSIFLEKEGKRPKKKVTTATW